MTAEVSKVAPYAPIVSNGVKITVQRAYVPIVKSEVQAAGIAVYVPIIATKRGRRRQVTIVN